MTTGYLVEMAVVIIKAHRVETTVGLVNTFNAAEHCIKVMRREVASRPSGSDFLVFPSGQWAEIHAGDDDLRG